jgi:hypothetical protein
MVKDLAREYRTRIEMRQIGARDEARIAADFETCGREVCCKVFLKTLKPISMRMAKVQKATLDPSQVSGRCGRLKCCLRYEHLAYEELDKRLPRNGIRIRTKHGEGVVVSRQVLTQLVQFRADDDSLTTVSIEDVTAVDVKPGETSDHPPAANGKQGKSGDRPPERKSSTQRPARPSPGRSKPRHHAEPAGADSQGPQSASPKADKSAGAQPAKRRRKRRRRRSPDGARRSRGTDDNGSGPAQKR